MTSREIIIDLIDKQIINGQDAFTLINDLLKAEMLEAGQTLNASKQNNNNLGLSDNKIGVNSKPYSTAISDIYSNTALTGTSGTNISSI